MGFYLNMGFNKDEYGITCFASFAVVNRSLRTCIFLLLIMRSDAPISETHLDTLKSFNDVNLKNTDFRI